MEASHWGLYNKTLTAVMFELLRNFTILEIFVNTQPDTLVISQTYCFFLGTDNVPVVLTKWVVGLPMVVMFEAIGLA